MNTTAELIGDLRTLVGEPSTESSLADESEDLMALSEKLSGKPSLAEDESTPDLANLSPKELIDFLKNQSLENLSHYAILGVTEKASKKDIRQKYLALAPLAHPDRGEENLLIFQTIGKAYESLVEKSTISEDDQEENETNIADEKEFKEFLASVGSADLFVEDYDIDPIHKQISIYKDPHDPDQQYIERGRDLIKQNYAPYMSHEKFKLLNPIAQKELAILLAKQGEAYLTALKNNSNNPDLNNIPPDDIYDSIDLDSPHLEKVQGKIIAFCQQASLFEQSLNFINKHILNANSIAAITTDVVAPDSTDVVVPDLTDVVVRELTGIVEQDFTQISDLDGSELYLRGWLLIHGEEGIKSGALQLFLQYPGPERRALATVVGRYQAEYPGNNLKSIFDYYDIGNKKKREAYFNKWLNIDRKEFFLSYKKIYPNITLEEGSDYELSLRFCKLCHSKIMEKFVEELRKVPVSKDDNDWYQLGISSIEESEYGLTRSAFLYLSLGAQRYVAIQLGKKSEGNVVSESLNKLIAWANNREFVAKVGREEIKAGRAFITRAKFKALKPEEEKRSVAIKVGAELLLAYDDSPEPSYEQEDYIEKNEEKSKLLDTTTKVSTPLNFFEDWLQKSPSTASPLKKRRKTDADTPEPNIEYQRQRSQTP